jgi:hypothetical protein
MPRAHLPLILLILLSPPAGQPAPQPDIPYGFGSWDSDTLGNHRAVVRVESKADAVWAHVPWRRRDRDPDRKHLIVVDAATGARVTNVARAAITRESGDLVFQPATAPGDYFVYYLPWVGSGRSNYPRVTYPAPEATADPVWLRENGLSSDRLGARAWSALPRARTVRFEDIDELNAVYPMAVIATKEETAGLLKQHAGKPYLVFPEDRRYPIKMTDDLPRRWVERGAGRPFAGRALRGEFYAFQIGVYAAERSVDGLAVRFSELRGNDHVAVPPGAFRCVNLGGVDWAGKPFTKVVRIERGQVQALWCGVQVPQDVRAGTYRATATVAPLDMPETSIELTLEISSDTLADAGDDEPWRHSRLRWLDSTIALDDDLVAPYLPVTVSGRTLEVLGRTVALDEIGFPKSIESRFGPEMTRLADRGRPVLTAPVSLIAEDETGAALAWRPGGMRVVTQARGVAAWESTATAGGLSLETRASLEFDGLLEYAVSVRAARDVRLRDIRLEIPIARDVAKYMMGMGVKGGLRPREFDWWWNVRNNQDSAWVGDVNAGLQFSLKDDRYSRPLNTNFYTLKPLVMPASWSNDGKGGCRFRERGVATFLVTCYSGGRTMKAGEVQRYDFRLLLTPFHTLDTDAQWRTRFLHAYRPLDEAVATGANTLNVHHANDINPWINYPFLTAGAMKQYVDDAHARGLKVKIYYTVRELSNRAPEIFALRSLGTEIFADGPGGGYAWLQEQLGSGYIGGWFVPRIRDAAIVTSGVSRWHNYYLEGLDWIVRHVGIDGLYIDDVAFDRTVMKRVRKILDRGRPGALVDLHSANQYNARDGFASSANLYLEHFPYLNRLWFGEYFDYDFPPDFWLVEVSGIPFGLMGEMLQDGGNPWRGMLYGMTNRLPWEKSDPRRLWKVWDAFGMQGSRMIGYWVESVPVKTGDPDVLATVYVKPRAALVSIASWAASPVEVTLSIDWAALGLDPAKVSIEAPAVDDFQPGRRFSVGEPVPVEPKKGWLLILREQ